MSAVTHSSSETVSQWGWLVNEGLGLLNSRTCFPKKSDHRIHHIQRWKPDIFPLHLPLKLLYISVPWVIPRQVISPTVWEWKDLGTLMLLRCWSHCCHTYLNYHVGCHVGKKKKKNVPSCWLTDWVLTALEPWNCHSLCFILVRTESWCVVLLS